jgi:hypothetical protein
MNNPKNTGECLLYLFPNSIPFKDWSVLHIDGQYIIDDWNDSIGKQPTESELNAVSEKAEKTLKFKSIREQRNQLLSETDWMANSDVTMSDAWKKYRKDLRDLPASNADPSKIVFPTKPE